MIRNLLWAIDFRAMDVWGEALRGSSWYNSVLRTRGLAISSHVYLDTKFAGDYELVSYSENVVVDRDAMVFAHLGLYKKGALYMMQKAVEIQNGVVIGSRAAVLPGSVLGSQQNLGPGEFKLHE